MIIAITDKLGVPLGQRSLNDVCFTLDNLTLKNMFPVSMRITRSGYMELMVFGDDDGNLVETTSCRVKFDEAFAIAGREIEFLPGNLTMTLATEKLPLGKDKLLLGDK
jgi:hypothetical protein